MSVYMNKMRECIMLNPDKFNSTGQASAAGLNQPGATPQLTC